MEAQAVEVRLEAGAAEVVGHDPGAGSKRGLDVRGHGETALDRLLREQRGADHERRVRRVRAGRDRGDQHVSMSERHGRGREDLLGYVADPRRARAVVDHLDFGQRVRVFLPGNERLQLLLAPSNEWFLRRQCVGPDPRGEPARNAVRRFPVASLRGRLHQQLAEDAADVGERDPVLRPPGSGDARADGLEVELEQLGVVALPTPGHPEESLCLVVAAECRDVLLRATGREQVAAGLLVDRKEADRGAVLRRHVGNRGAIRHRERRGALAVELDELADDARLPEHLGHVQSQIRRRRAVYETPGHVDAHDIGRQHVDRLAEHAGFRFDSADAPADDPHAVDHRRVGVGPDERVRKEEAVPFDDAHGEPLHVDLVHDADARRHDLESMERARAPLQKLVTGAVPLELDFHVEAQRVRGGPVIHLDGMIDDEGDGDERLDDGRILSQPLDRRPHRREIHEERDAGEVLQDDPRDHERNFGRSLGVRSPVGELGDVVFPDAASIHVSQERLQDDPQADG